MHDFPDEAVPWPAPPLPRPQTNFYETHDQLRAHLQNFVDAYNFARRLKTLKGLTPYEFICKAWTSEPHRFTISPLQQMPGLNT